MPGHAEEEVVRQLGPVVQHGDRATRVERTHAAAGYELDLALGKRLEQRVRGVR
jgi:hypothetical protein